MNLDVGCGLNFKGDVNTDLFLETTKGRSNVEKEWKHRINAKAIPNFVRSDIHHLPFRNNQFHTVYCHHVLEHKGINYIKAIKELLRVTKYKLEICVPHFLMKGAKGGDHARVFRSRHLNKIFRNYYHTIKWNWSMFPFPKPRENVVTVYKELGVF